MHIYFKKFQSAPENIQIDIIWKLILRENIFFFSSIVHLCVVELRELVLLIIIIILTKK